MAPALSEYEQKRLVRIAENAKQMELLGITSAKKVGGFKNNAPTTNSLGRASITNSSLGALQDFADLVPEEAKKVKKKKRKAHDSEEEYDEDYSDGASEDFDEEEEEDEEDEEDDLMQLRGEASSKSKSKVATRAKASKVSRTPLTTWCSWTGHQREKEGGRFHSGLVRVRV